LKVSRNLVAGAPLEEEMVRRKEVWRCKVVRSDVALLIRRNAMDIGMIQRSPENGSAKTFLQLNYWRDMILHQGLGFNFFYSSLLLCGNMPLIK
jgi:hypothetical protein